MLVMLSTDLMMIGKVRHLAQIRGIELITVPSIEQLPPPAGCEGKKILLADLQADACDPQKIADWASNQNATVFAYAQHVYTDILDRARNSGVENVLTRGQFDRQIGSIIESLD